MHLLVPHFVDDRPETRDALHATPPAALVRWLQHAQPVARSAAPAAAGYASGVERYVADAVSLDVPDGALPWVALQRHWQGLPADGVWGELRLVHWRVGRDDIVLHPQLALGVTPDEHAAIEHRIAALLHDDGLQLHTVQPGVWHLRGDLLRGLRTASAVRAAGRDMRNFQPLAEDGRVARTWQRVAAELQMLLYTHPVNDAREAQGRLPLNAAWLSGCGPLPEVPPAPLGVQWRDAHVAPLLTGDVQGYMQTMLQETLGSSMVEVDVLTLCGVDAWCTFARRAPTLRTRVQAAIAALRSPGAALEAVLDHLAPKVPA